MVYTNEYIIREIINILERYSNGKEPHWKCGVPQGIVRSSRILSAKERKTRIIAGFSIFYTKFLYLCL